MSRFSGAATSRSPASPEIRAFLHGPDPLIVTKANSKSVVHRRIYLDYIGIKTFDAKGKLLGELRIVGLFTSTAYTRFGPQDPLSALQGAGGDRKVRLTTRPIHSGQGADQCAGILSARRAVPGRHLNAQAQRHGHPWHWASVRALRASLPGLDQFETASSPLWSSVPRDTPLRSSEIRQKESGAIWPKPSTRHISAYYRGLSRRLAGAGPFSSWAARRQERRHPPQETLEAAIRGIVRNLGRRDAAKPFPTPQAEPQLADIAMRLPESYRNSFSPETRFGRCRPHPIGLRAERPNRDRLLRAGAARRRRRSASRSTICMRPVLAVAARAPMLEAYGLFSVSSASAPSKWRLPDDDTVPFFNDNGASKARLAWNNDLSDGGGAAEKRSSVGLERERHGWRRNISALVPDRGA